MFQAIQYVRYDSLSYKYIYKLTDSDFETEFGVAAGVAAAVADGVEVEVEVAAAVEVATEYEKRNLNAAANLALMLKKGMEYTGYDLNKIVELNYEYYPELSKEFYNKYLADIKKYLLLS